MTATPSREFVIHQLESLREHCQDFAEDSGSGVWADDVEALDKAIQELSMARHTSITPGLHFKPRKERESMDFIHKDDMSCKMTASLVIFYATTIFGAAAALGAIVSLLVGATQFSERFCIMAFFWWAEALVARGGIPDES